MSLKGSLQTVALPEVLGFLSGTSKTGELNVDGTTGQGFLWFQDGVISGVRVERGPNPVEAVFQLLRIEDGEFSFTAGATAPDDVRAVDAGDGQVAAVLEQAQERMGEWQDIVAVVPSLEHRVTLVADAPEDSVLLEREQWSLVVAIGEGRTVDQVIAARDLGEFDGCRAIKALVEAALVQVDEPPAPAEDTTVQDTVAEDTVEDQPVADETGALADHAEPESVPPMLSPLAALSGFTAFGPLAGQAPEATAGEVAVEDGAQGGEHHEHPAIEVEGGDDHYPSLQSMVNEVGQAIDEDGQPEEHDLLVPPADLAMPAFGSPEGLDVLHGVDTLHGTDTLNGTEHLAASEVLIGTEHSTGAEHLDEADTGTSSRAALQALLDQVAAEDYSDDEYAGDDSAAAVHSTTGFGDEVVDGLADRGPWTHNELASFDGWRDEEAAAEAATAEPAFHASAEAGFTPTNFAEGAEVGVGFGMAAEADPATYGADTAVEAEAEAEAEEPPAPAEEPINRGLLLKFLSSVRN